MRTRWVKAAAALLGSGDGDYELSGWITPVTEQQWRAYVALAPFVYGSDVWTEDMRPLAEVNDEGSSMVVHVSIDRLDEVRRATAPAEVLPLRRRR